MTRLKHYKRIIDDRTHRVRGKDESLGAERDTVRRLDAAIDDCKRLQETICTVCPLCLNGGCKLWERRLAAVDDLINHEDYTGGDNGRFDEAVSPVREQEGRGGLRLVRDPEPGTDL